MTKHSQNGFGRLCWCAALLGLALAGCMNVTPPSGKSEDFEHSSDRPPSARTLYSMARVMVAQGQDDQAKFVLARVLHVHPDFVPAYCAMAELQMRARHVDEAMETLSDGLKIAPQDAILHNDVGMCRVMKKDYGVALKEFTSATALAPADSRYRGNMAMALGMLGRYEESVELYKQIMPESDAHFNLAVICEARDDTAKAGEEYKQAKVLHDRADKAKGGASTGGAVSSNGPVEKG